MANADADVGNGEQEGREAQLTALGSQFAQQGDGGGYEEQLRQAEILHAQQKDQKSGGKQAAAGGEAEAQHGEIGGQQVLQEAAQVGRIEVNQVVQAGEAARDGVQDRQDFGGVPPCVRVTLPRKGAGDCDHAAAAPAPPAVSAKRQWLGSRAGRARSLAMTRSTAWAMREWARSNRGSWSRVKASRSR